MVLFKSLFDQWFKKNTVRISIAGEPAPEYPSGDNVENALRQSEFQSLFQNVNQDRQRMPVTVRK